MLLSVWDTSMAFYNKSLCSWVISSYQTTDFIDYLWNMAYSGSLSGHAQVSNSGFFLFFARSHLTPYEFHFLTYYLCQKNGDTPGLHLTHSNDLHMWNYFTLEKAMLYPSLYLSVFGCIRAQSQLWSIIALNVHSSLQHWAFTSWAHKNLPIKFNLSSCVLISLCWNPCILDFHSSNSTRFI